MSSGLWGGSPGLNYGSSGLWNGAPGLWSGAPGFAGGGGAGPALDLDFTTGVLDPRITFSRASLATMYDSTGKLTWCPNNLLTYSEQFDNVSGWAIFGAAITPNTTVAPDGTTTADTCVLNATPNPGDLAVVDSIGVAVKAVPHIFSVWLKGAVGGETLYLSGTPDGATYIRQQVTLTTSWARYSLVGTPTTVNWYWAIGYDRRDAGQGAGPAMTFYAWGAQLEAVTYQTTPRTYNPTTGTAYYGPRFEYDPATLAAKGLLIEEARTNLLVYSNTFSDGAWTKNNTVVTAASAISPDGTNNGWKLQANGAVPDPTSHLRPSVGTSLHDTASIYAKKGTSNNLCYSNNVGGVNSWAQFDLNAGIVYSSSGCTASIQNCGNGWYRCTAADLVAGAYNIWQLVDALTLTAPFGFSNATLGIYIYVYGAQLEAGAAASSYIPTTSVAVTRAKDVAVMTGTNFSSWYNQPEGTFVVAFDMAETAVLGDTTRILTTDDGTSANRTVDMHELNGAVNDYNGTVALVAAGTILANTLVKVAAVYKTASYALCRDGGAVATDATVAVKTPTLLGIGCFPSTGVVQQINGHIKSVTYYNTRKTNAELQALTALPSSFDFTTGMLPSGVTITRASTGTYFDNTLVMRTAFANVARFDYLGGVGLLLEPASTNQAVRSGDLSDPAWSVRTNVTLTGGFATAPDGTMSGTRIQAGSGGAYCMQLATALASQPQVVSMWANRAVGADQTFGLGCTQQSVEEFNSGDLVATAQWQRFSFSAVFLAGGTGLAYVGPRTPGAVAHDIVAWGFQLENNRATPTSYIPTAGATATRALETLNFTVPAGMSYAIITYLDGTTQSFARASGPATITGAELTGSSFKIKTLTFSTAPVAIEIVDFVNGVYSIFGVPKTLMQMGESEPSWATFDPSYVVAGAGLKARSTVSGALGTSMAFTPEAYAPLARGFVAVIDYYVNRSAGNTGGDILVLMDQPNVPSYSAGLGARIAWLDADANPLLYMIDYASNPPVSTTPGEGRMAVRFDPADIAGAANGGPLCHKVSPNAVGINRLMLQVKAQLVTGTWCEAIIRKVVFYSLSAYVNADLPGLSALTMARGFDPSFNSSASLTYSEGDRLVVRTTAVQRRAVRGLTGHASGKWYAELLPIGARLRFAGVVDASFTTTGAGGAPGTNRAGIEGSSLIAYPGVDDDTGHFATPGTIVRFAYDADADLFWLALAGGDWNDNPAADPVLGTGGLSAGGLVGAGYVGATLRPVTGAGVRYRLPGDTGYSLPSGYSEWSQS